MDGVGGERLEGAGKGWRGRIRPAKPSGVHLRFTAEIQSRPVLDADLSWAQTAAPDKPVTSGACLLLRHRAFLRGGSLTPREAYNKQKRVYETTLAFLKQFDKEVALSFLATNMQLRGELGILYEKLLEELN